MRSNFKGLVSIIIPTYNRAHLIGETLDSVLAQIYTNWECIVVDDGSTDNTAELMAEYCNKDVRFHYCHRPNDKPKGANSCRNFGFELSKGEYIQFFDSDDLYIDFAIEKILLKFQNNYDVVVCKLTYFDDTLYNANKINVIFSDSIIEDYLVGKLAFYISGPTWRRNFLEQQRYLFDEEISNLDDWDFNLRMLYQNPVIKFLEEPLIYYRVHENSLAHETGKLNFIEIKSEFKAREKHIKLLKDNKLAPYKNLKYFIKNRYKFLLRASLMQNSKLKFYLYKKTVNAQMDLFEFLGVLKITIGFVVYILFKKGYRFLK